MTINREVMQAFSAAADVDFAYNTLRVIPTPQEPDSRISEMLQPEFDRRS